MMAVLLCSGLAKRMNGQVKPLVKVGGREILYRSMKLLEKNGIRRFVVVVNEKNKEKIEKFLNENDFKFELIVNPYPERGNGYSLYLAKNKVHDRFVLAMGDHIFGEGFVRKAVRAKGLVCDRNPRYVDVEEATKVKVELDRVVDIGKNLENFDCFDTGFFVLDVGIFDVAERLVKEKSVVELSDIVREAKLDVSYVDGELWMDIDTPEDVKKAERNLFDESVKGKGDGIVSRKINRKISKRISRVLVDKISPNQATALSFFAGILSSLVLFFSIPLAGILYQISSVLDGVDGEIARVTMKTSKIGGVLDSILDRIVDFLFLSILAFLTLSTKNEFFLAFLAIFGTLMVSYISERYKGEFNEGFYSRFNILIPGKRDERIFIIMLFCLFYPTLRTTYLFLFIGILTNMRVFEMVLRLINSRAYIIDNHSS